MILKVHQVSKDFVGLRALDRVSFTVEEEEICGIIGPNGAGKTTLFNLITGFHHVTGGGIEFKGVDITNLKTYKRTKMGIGRTFQNIRIFPRMTTFQNIWVAQNYRARSGFNSLFVFRSSNEAKLCAEVEQLLEFMALLDRKDVFAQNLTFVDQRRLEIARALATNCNLLLLDEPAAGMTAEETEELIRTIKKIRDMGRTILLIEHHMNVIMRLSEHVVVLNFGQKIAEGSPLEVQNDRDVIEAYLGSRKKI